MKTILDNLLFFLSTYRKSKYCVQKANTVNQTSMYLLFHAEFVLMYSIANNFTYNTTSYIKYIMHACNSVSLSARCFMIIFPFTNKRKVRYPCVLSTKCLRRPDCSLGSVLDGCIRCVLMLGIHV